MIFASFRNDQDFQCGGPADAVQGGGDLDDYYAGHFLRATNARRSGSSGGQFEAGNPFDLNALLDETDLDSRPA